MLLEIRLIGGPRDGITVHVPYLGDAPQMFVLEEPVVGARCACGASTVTAPDGSIASAPATRDVFYRFESQEPSDDPTIFSVLRYVHASEDEAIEIAKRAHEEDEHHSR